MLTAENSTDYRLHMRPSDLVALKRDTVERSIQTISNRINQLGLTEPTVQQYGQAGIDFEILVELPGVDDPARVKEHHADHRAVWRSTTSKKGPSPAGSRPWRRRAASCR